ncbi:MAG: OsmC family protein [Kineosporiaceae bacterium]
MAEDSHRFVTLDRVEEGIYVARNARGLELRFGSKDPEGFTPVELLLAAIAGCSAVDVDVVTGRRSPADQFRARVDAEYVRDEQGNRLTDVTLTFQVRFPEGEAGDAAREILPRAIRTSHDRTCTVSRSLELGTPVTTRIEDAARG